MSETDPGSSSNHRRRRLLLQLNDLVAWLLRRIDSISVPTPGGPVTVGIRQPDDNERRIAQRVLTILEDRRVLYDPPHQEVVSWCRGSVQYIRERLQGELEGLPSASNRLRGSVRLMLEASRQFLTRTAGLNDGDVDDGGWMRWQAPDLLRLQFETALAAFRELMILQTEQLANDYALPIPARLRGGTTQTRHD